MPESVAKAHCIVAASEAWRVARDPAAWAYLMPGYAGFEMLDANTYRMTIKRNLGFITKTVEAEIRVIEENPEELRARFSLKGLNEPFDGEGSVVFAPTVEGVRLDLTFRILARGPMAPMVNPILTRQLPAVMNRFVERLASWIEAQVAGDSTPA